MGWETRGDRKYFYVARRVDGRVVKTYVPFAVVGLVEDTERLLRADRVEAAARRRAERDKIATLDETVRTFGDVVDALVTAARLAAGFHNHRGQWRRRRHGPGLPPRVPDSVHHPVG